MKNTQLTANGNPIMKTMFFIFSILLLLNCGVTAQVRMSNQDKPESDMLSRTPSSGNHAHDVINFVNGKQINADVISIDSSMLSCMIVGKHRSHPKKCNLDNVFNVVFKDGTEQVFYRQDTASDEHYMTSEEMQNYMQGAQDARRNFRSPFSTITGIFTGATSAAIGFWSLPLIFIHPYICASLSSEKKSDPFENVEPKGDVINQLSSTGPERSPIYGKKTVEKKSGKMLYESFKYDKNPQLLNCYKMGYQDAACEKKAFNALKGNVGGFISVLLISVLFVL
jgi:hypothetical protein